MAETDGSLKIRVDLDTKEFKAGTKDLEAAARKTAGKISDIGDKTKIALEKQLNAFTALNQQYARQEQKVEQLKQKLKELSGQKVETEEFVKIKKQIDADTKKLNTLISKMEELNSSGKKNVLSQEYKEIAKQIETTTSKLSRLEETQELFIKTGGKRSSGAYQKRELQIDELRKALANLETEQKELLKSGGKYTMSPAYAKLELQIKKIRDSIKSTKAEQDKLLSSGSAYQKADNQDLVNTLQTRLGNEQEKLNQMGSRLATSSSALNSKLQELKEKEDAAAVSADDLANSENKLTVVINKLKQAASKAGGMIRKMATFAGKGISAIRNLGGQSDQTRMSLGKMLATSLLFSTVFRALSLVTSGIQAGFTNLAQYSNQTNASISSLVTALTYLKNSFATAFAPILNVVAPILTTFINMLARAVTYVGMFFAALTGQKSFQRAIPVQENFAAGLADTASNAQDAADGIKNAAEAANDYLSPLDEISRFETQKDSGSGGGSGGGGSLPGYTPPSASEMFETVPIESAIQDFADKIKDLIAAQDWDGLGELLADKINGVFAVIKDAISWEKVGPQITYFVNAFTATFNSLIYNIDWDLIGRTVGTGINTIVNTLYLLITGIDWKLLGSSFATGINGLVDEVDWWNLGALLGQKFMIAWNTLYGFVTTLNWSEVGLAIANGINGAVANIDPFTMAEGINSFVLGILTTIQSAAETTDWTMVGQKIADMIKTIDWVGIAAQLYETGKTLINGILEAFGELPAPVIIATGLILAFWAAVMVGKAIQEVISLGQTLGGVIGALTSPIGIVILAIGALVAAGVFLWQNWDTIKEKAIEIWSAISDWFGDVTAAIGDFFSDLWDGIVDTFTGVGDWFTEKFQSAKDGIIGVWQDVVDWFTTNITDPLKNLFDTLWTNISDFASEKFNSITETINSIVNGVKGVINGMIEAVEKGINWIVDGANKISFSVPNWVPGIGGNSFGINIPHADLPRLATGTVVPARAGEFLAMLGDNNRETEVVSPLSTMKQALKEALLEVGGNSGNVTVQVIAQVNRRVLFEEVIEEAKIRQSRSGENPFAMT